MFKTDVNVLFISSLLATVLTLQVYFLFTRIEGIKLDDLDREKNDRDIYLRAGILESIQSRIQTLEQKLNKLEDSYRKVEDIETNVQTIPSMISKYTSIEFKLDNAFESFAHVKELSQNIDKIEKDVVILKNVVTKNANEQKQSYRKVEDIETNVQTISSMISKYTSVEFKIDNAFESFAHVKELSQNIDKIEKDVVILKNVVTKNANEQKQSYRKVEDIETNVQTISSMISKYTSIEFKIDNAFESFAHVKELSQNIDKTEKDVVNLKNVVTKNANEQKQTIQQIKSSLKSEMDSHSTKMAVEMQALRQRITNKMYTYKDKGASFSARLTRTDSSYTGPKQILRFNEVIHNEGDGYSIHDGKFTAQEDGVYLFIFTIETGARDTISSLTSRTALVDLVVDDKFKASAIATYSNAKDTSTGSNAVITYVTKGQKVWIHTPGHNKDKWININAYRTTFTGVLLYR